MTTQTRQLPVSVDAAWPLVRRTIERRAMRLKRATGMKLPLAATRVMERDPALFRIYQRAMLAGHAPEFVRPKAVRDTPREQAWQKIERAGRRLVAESERPMTLWEAGQQVVRRPPSSYERYASTK